MKIRMSVFSLLVVAATLVSACGAATPTPAAVMKETPTAEAMMASATPTAAAMMGKETATPEAMMSSGTPTPEAMMSSGTATPEAMMTNGTSTPEAMMVSGTATPEAMMSSGTATPEVMMTNGTPTPEAMKNQGMMAAPAWYGAGLTDVNTGAAFKVGDWKGKVVLVEITAVQCPACLEQASAIQALHKLVGMRDDFVSLGLDIDANAAADGLKAYTAKNGLDWPYAVAPAAVAREIGQLYGDQALTPPSLLIIDRQGQAHALPTGVKSAQALQEALSMYLK